MIIFKKFKKYLLEHDLLKKGDSVILAISGGVDSMVLLDLMRRVAKEMELKLIAAHINHGLRGRASELDEKLVRDAAGRCGIPCEVLKKKPSAGKNLQDSARRIRYEFLEDAAKKHGARAVFTAHHRDDQAETIIAHLIRGSALNGLSGMKPHSRLGENIHLIRPMLFATRAEIENHAKKNRIKFREDKSNAGTKYRRNKIRHTLIPILKKFNPRIIEAIASTGEKLALDNEAIEIMSREAFDQLGASVSPSGIEFQREGYIHLPKAMRTKLLFIAFEKASGTSLDLNADQIQKMDEISVGKNPQGQYRLRAPWKFIRSGETLAIVQSDTTHDRS